MNRPWRVAGINFDHMHMGDLLRLVNLHPNAEIVGVSDPDVDKMRSVTAPLDLSPDKLFTDYRECLERTIPDIVILCPATAEHGVWTDRVAPFGTHILMEKPFAASLAEADRMIEAVSKTGKQLVINWPLRWYPTHMTAKRLIDEGAIGDVVEVHYYDGNRGPLRTTVDGVETPLLDPGEKSQSWWYRQETGGGSMLDYLGYGVTLGTWFMNGKAPLEVTAVTDEPIGLEVDEHCVAVCRYEQGLSKYETRWGTYTDPWRIQPQPKCGFVMVGTEGTLSSYDYEPAVRLQNCAYLQGIEIAVDVPSFPFRNPIEYLLDCLENNRPIDGPLSPTISRIGQQIVDSAALSAREKRTVRLLTGETK